jgi:hypothetical protein
MKSLEELAEFYGTDKAISGHGYVKYYDGYFSSIRDSCKSLIEIGVQELAKKKYGAASLRMWEEYFPNANIYGIDIGDLTHLSNNRVKVYQSSQVDFDALKNIFTDINLIPEIIIDDGSHSPDDQQRTYEYLFDFLAPGGFYLIEDIAEWNFYKSSNGFIFDAEKQNIYGDEHNIPFVHTSLISQNPVFMVSTLFVFSNFCFTGKIKSHFIKNPEKMEKLIQYINIHASSQPNQYLAVIKKLNNEYGLFLRNQALLMSSESRIV